MRVVINGQDRRVEPGVTVEVLVERFSRERINLLVELNGRFVFPHRYGETVIREDDRVEFIVPAFGG